MEATKTMIIVKTTHVLGEKRHEQTHEIDLDKLLDGRSAAFGMGGLDGQGYQVSITASR